MSDDLHPDFLKASPEQRWRGKLDLLLLQLYTEAKTGYVTREEIELDRGWKWRVLPRGAFVGLRRRLDIPPAKCARYELRIARSGALTESANTRWDVEVGTFLDHFQIKPTDGRTPALSPDRYWMRSPLLERDAGKPVLRLVSLMLGEVRPGVAFCWDCLHRDPPIENEIVWEVVYGASGQACGPCALERGRAEQRAHASRGQQAAFL